MKYLKKSALYQLMDKYKMKRIVDLGLNLVEPMTTKQEENRDITESSIKRQVLLHD